MGELEGRREAGRCQLLQSVHGQPDVRWCLRPRISQTDEGPHDDGGHSLAFRQARKASSPVGICRRPGMFKPCSEQASHAFSRAESAMDTPGCQHVRQRRELEGRAPGSFPDLVAFNHITSLTDSGVWSAREFWLRASVAVVRCWLSWEPAGGDRGAAGASWAPSARRVTELTA